jgi:lysozyme family protein
MLFAVAPLCATPAEQSARWEHGSVDPHQTIALDKLITRYQRTKAIYDQIEGMVPNGIPSAVCFGLLYRECDNDLSANPAQGDPLTHRSVHVPRNRIPGKTPPFTFLDAAADAYYAPDLDRMQTRDWAHAGALLDAVENFNGGGYRKLGLTSPYVWNGVTGDAKFNFYLAGKYVSDGRFSRTFKDQQLGVAAILLRMRERGMAIPASLERPAAPGAAKAAPAAPVPQIHVAPPQEPEEEERAPQPSGAPLSSAIQWAMNFLRGLLP